jgi:hypothetical protein
MKIDATGDVGKSMEEPHGAKNKSMYLYSIGIHDPIQKITMSVADWFSEAHSSYAIAKYLEVFKRFIEIKSGFSHKDAKKRGIAQFCFPKIIVTDFSWATIHAVLKTFNNTNINTYLKWSFDILINKTEDSYLINGMLILI